MVVLDLSNYPHVNITRVQHQRQDQEKVQTKERHPEYNEIENSLLMNEESEESDTIKVQVCRIQQLSFWYSSEEAYKDEIAHIRIFINNYNAKVEIELNYLSDCNKIY